MESHDEVDATAMAEEIMLAADVISKNGQLSLNELTSYSKRASGDHARFFEWLLSKKGRFHQLDEDHSHTLEVGELEAAIESWKNEELLVAAAEAAAAPKPQRPPSRQLPALPLGGSDWRSSDRWALQPGSDEDHHAFAVRMWKRMDRDESGLMTRDELDCEEFRTIIRSVLVPEHAGTGGVTYSRSQMNATQAIGFCLRKADLNKDGVLTFKEFESFLRSLRDVNLAKHTAYLIFALFDLNGNGYIEENEFREIYRFFLGHHPTAKDFEEEWNRLNVQDTGQVSVAQYTWWLRTSTKTVFRQHAPEQEEDAGPGETVAATLSKASAAAGATDDVAAVGGSFAVAAAATAGTEGFGSGFGSISTLPESPAPTAATLMRSTWSGAFHSGGRPQWIQKLNKKNMNDVMPKGQRTYFSRPQSLPQLGRYYELHRGFKSHRRAGATIPDPKRKSPVLSNYIKPFLEERYKPGGTMLGKDGKVVQWQDEFLVPIALKPRIKPAVLDFQHPGPPPRWVTHYKEDGDAWPMERCWPI